MHDLKAIAASIDGRFASIDSRFTTFDAQFARVEGQLDRIERALFEIKTLFTATFPHLATKADVADVRTELQVVRTELKEDIVEVKVALADKPSRTYMWGILVVLLTAYACGLAALAVLR